jgi:HSP20 family protein
MVKRIVLEELGLIQEQVNALFEQALLSSGADVGDDSPQPPGLWSPAVDVVETADAFVIHAELPGVRREDIRLEVHGHDLELAGTRRGLAAGESFLRLERSYGSFKRSFRLPTAVLGDRIEATLRQGVLEVRLPKRSPTVPVTHAEPEA